MSMANRLGAIFWDDGHCQFRVWAPLAQKVAVHIVAPQERAWPMESEERGYYQLLTDEVKPGSLYFYRLDDRTERPDLASRFQPEGVHGPSQAVDSRFPWEDSRWSGLPLAEFIIYEIHVGTFTPEGTFDAVIPYLDGLKELGITAIELMPVAQFPGNRNWGYDGVYLFAVQNSYGGPQGLQRLVNTCHQKGLAVILDVVYNHLGPEGNYLSDFGVYFTDRYQTPWGAALNFDGADSDEVRHFFIENALYWITEFHLDALRLDALHAILDITPRTFLEELATSVHELSAQLNRRVYLIGESTLNDRRLIRSPELGGYGLDAQWNDDFHHALHGLLTGEQNGYYQDFGCLQHLAKAFQEGFVYSGEYSVYRQRRHGTSSRDIPAHSFVVFAQNHDQVGNRMRSERLSQLVSFEELKLAAGIVLLSPYIPLIFMGEEYGETAPFPYFISHSDPTLVAAVQRGRREEFAAFQWQGELPDPQNETTFQLAKLNHSLRNEAKHRVLLEFYRELIRLRRENSALAHLSKDSLEVVADEESKLLLVRRWSESEEVFVVFNFSDSPISPTLPIPPGRWRKILDSADRTWYGYGSSIPDAVNLGEVVTLTLAPKTFALFTRQPEL